MSLAQAWEFAKRWFGDVLLPDFRGRTAQQAQAIFDSLGLASDHWRVT